MIFKIIMHQKRLPSKFITFHLLHSPNHINLFLFLPYQLSKY